MKQILFFLAVIVTFVAMVWFVMTKVREVREQSDEESRAKNPAAQVEPANGP